MATLLTSLAIAIIGLMYLITKETQKEADEINRKLERLEQEKHWLEQCEKYGAGK